VSRIDRLIGLARSLAIYHGIAGRQRRFRQFYASLVEPGDLVFDIGAHAGNRTRALATLGCRVLAVEPQPDFTRLLHWLFRGHANVTVLDCAVADRPGRATLAISQRTPTVTTLAPAWLAARAAEPGFSGVRWNERVDVETTTLDRLIAQHGVPRLVKIDAEGSDPAILAGLSHPVEYVSFEFLPPAVDAAEQCVRRLNEIGRYRFNCLMGEGTSFVSERWQGEAEVLETLRSLNRQFRAVDVYARCEPAARGDVGQTAP